MNDDLTILCVTRPSDRTAAFVDALDRESESLGCQFVLWEDKSDWGYLEAVLDEALMSCTDGYVLRVDDDERISPGMHVWLAAGEYRQAQHWAFPRWNLWPDEEHYIENKPLWPDLQTRLSMRRLAGGRVGVHDGSPYGTGRVAPVALEHWKFLVKSREERELLVEHYESLRPGAGNGYAMFSVPERYEDLLSVKLTRSPVLA